MVVVVTASNRRQYPKRLDSMFEDRKKVFVDLLKWDIPITDGRYEIDQFDDDNAIYLIVADADNLHMGSLRLLRTQYPHILGSLFPYLCERSVPADSTTLEITRLCLSPELPAWVRLRVRNALISTMVDCALKMGVETLTGVVTAGFLAQVLKMGWRCDALGPTRIVDGTTIGAFRIDIDGATPQQLLANGIYISDALDEYSRCEA